MSSIALRVCGLQVVSESGGERSEGWGIAEARLEPVVQTDMKKKINVTAHQVLCAPCIQFRKS